MKKAIITGGTGFVGSNLCRYLLKSGWKVFLITRLSSKYDNIDDIKNEVEIYTYDGSIEDLISFFREKNADVVFHLASLVIVEHVSSQIDDLVDSNIKFGLHILEAMKESDTKIIINTGTSWQHYNSDEYMPVDLYAATKEAFVNLLKYYIDAENVRGITLKLFDTYGETDKRPKLINLLYEFSENKMKIDMSLGEQYIDLVHVDDVVKAYLKAYRHLNDNNIKYGEYAVATGIRVKLREVVALFEKISEKTLDIDWGARTYRKREVMSLWTNYNILPNWEAKISLEEGLKRIISK